MTTTISEIEITELVDLGAEMNCNAPRCLNEVKWIAVYPCCKLEWHLCGEHKEFLIAKVSKMSNILCLTCVAVGLRADDFIKGIRPV